MQLAYLYLSAGKTHKASNVIRQAFEAVNAFAKHSTVPKNLHAMLLFRVGWHFVNIQEFESGKVALEQAYELNPVSPAVSVGLAVCRFELGEPQKARLLLLELGDGIRALTKQLRNIARGILADTKQEL